MTIRHLKIFIEVAGTGNMSQAAEKLFITQPSVSQAIADIERYYRIRLFERFSKKLFITEAGRELLGYARHIVSLFEEMEAVALKRAEVPFLRVGATVTVGTCVIGPVLEQLKAVRPETETAVMVDNTRVIEEKLVQSELDVALVEGRIKSVELKVEPVVNDQLVLIAGRDHPFYKRKKVQLAELDGQPFILREKGSGTRELFEERMAAEGYRLREKWVCNNSEAIKRAVMSGQGLSVISTLLVEEEIRGIIKQYLDSQNDVEVVGVAGDGMQALELLNQVEADVMVLDIIMPELDGFGVLERMSSCTGKRPDVIMLTALGQEDLVRKAINLGAKYYMVKPLDLGVLTQRVVELGRMQNQTVLSVPPIAAAAPQPARSLEEKITSIFLTIGIPAHIKGYHYLRYAVKLAVENNDIISRITKELYPSIAKHFDTTPSKVERAIRHAIEVAWNRGKIENINQLFGFHVYTKSDKPTNGEFIALVADKLIMEKSA